MASSPDAYVDTSALIAFADGSDTHHALFRRLFAAPPKLLTTALVVAEGHGWFLRRFDATRALQFLAMVEALKPLTVLAVGKRQLESGSQLLRRFADQALTMTDAVGLHIIAVRSLDVCWSTDFHLGLTGATLAIHQH